MIRVLLSCVSILVAASSFSQVRFGVTAGGTLSISDQPDFRGRNSAGQQYSVTNNSLLGFYLGGVVEKPIGRFLSFRPQLHYIKKGENYDVKLDTENKVYKDQAVYHYLELPLNIVFNEAVRSGKFFIGLGPSVAYAIKGVLKTEGEPEEDIPFGSDGPTPLDLGINFIGGYQLKGGAFLNVHYNLGLRDVYPNFRNKNRTFGLGIGKFF